MEHTKVSSIPKSFLCGQCRKGFSFKQHLQIHITSIHENEKISCDLCTKLFSTRSSMIRHKKTAHIFICDACQEHFRSKQTLINHKRTAHIFICDVCEKSFRSKQTLIKHYLPYCKDSHKKTAHIFICDVCQESFRIKQALIKHLPYCNFSKDNAKQTLPEQFEYDIIKYTKIGENEFYCSFKFNISCVEDGLKWIQMYENINYLSFRKRKGRFKSENVLHYMTYRCHHNTFPKKNTVPSRKHTNCPAHFIMKIKTCGQDSNKFEATVKLHNNHNHSTYSAAALKHRIPQQDVVDKFKMLFEAGHIPSKAYLIHKQDVELDHDQDFHLVSADRSIIPDLSWVYRLYYKIFQGNYGAYNGKKMIESIENFLNDYNQNNGHCTCINIDGDQFEIAIYTPFMRRVSNNIQNSAEMIFIDSSGNIDRFRCKVFLMITNSCAGGLPVGVIITTSESEDSITRGLKLYTSLLDNESFYGRGIQGPLLFMTDDSSAEQASLRNVFPESTLLLCSFHILQATWRYLCNSNTGIQLQFRQQLFNYVKQLLYASTEDLLKKNYDLAIECSLTQQYNKFVSYLQKLYGKRTEWAICYRQDLITCGQNMNNLCESADCVLKEKILQRIKAYSPAQLVDFILNDYNNYYIQKLIDVANGRIPKYLLSKENTNYDYLSLQFIKNNKFEVKNEKSGGLYEVDGSIGCCTCPIGVTGRLCNHQIFVSMHIEKDLPMSIPHIAEIKTLLLNIATATDNFPSNWFQLLHSKENQNQNIPPFINPINEQESNNTFQENFEYLLSSDTSVELLKDEARKLFENILTKIDDEESVREALRKWVKTQKNMKTNAALTEALSTYGSYSL